MQVPDLSHRVCYGRLRRWERVPLKGEVTIVVVREGIDGGPEPHPVSHLPEDIPVHPSDMNR